MKKRRIIIIILALLIGILVAFNYKTMAKFVTDRITSYYLRSKNFYFSSNLLDPTNPTYQIGTWSGTGNFSVSFDLFSKDNQYLFSESDITYEITYQCSSDVLCSATKSAGTLYANDSNHSETITINIAPQRVFLADERVTINVTARSTSPYVKILRAQFIYIVGREGVSYEIADEANRTYLFLKVINDINYCTVITDFGDYEVGDHISNAEYRNLSEANKSKCISQYINVSFSPQQLLIDNTIELLKSATTTTQTINGVNYINSIRFPMNPDSTEAIKFYKINTTLDNTYPHGNNASIVTVTASNPI